MRVYQRVCARVAYVTGNTIRVYDTDTVEILGESPGTRGISAATRGRGGPDRGVCEFDVGEISAMKGDQ